MSLAMIKQGKGRKTLEQWIAEAMIDEDKEGKLSMFSLVHMIGMQQQEVHTTKFGSKAWSPRDLAEMFQSKAEVYAQDLPGVQTFNVLAFYGGRNNPEARYLFLVNQKHGFEGLSTEPPTEQGTRMQSMRHLEMGIQQVYARQQAMDQFCINMIGRLDSHISNLETENRDMFTVIKEVMMKQISDNREHEMKKLEYERSSKTREQFLKAAPPLVNTILGKEVFPTSTEDTAIIEMLAEHLTPEALSELMSSKLGQSLPPLLLGALVSRMSKVLDKKALEEKEKEKLLPSPNPEDDAAGD